jgi:hypothetical protein
LNQGKLETGDLQQPELLIANLNQRPDQAMYLLTKTDIGEPIMNYWDDLPLNLGEAALEMLQEIVNMLKATSATDYRFCS